MAQIPGGPAFPMYPDPRRAARSLSEATGMFLRDWFAGQSLAGILGNVMAEHAAASEAYAYADAMLAEREKGISQ